MSKSVTFTAGAAAFGREIKVIDSFKTIKKLNEGVGSLFKKMEKYEQKQAEQGKSVYLTDYETIISECVMAETANLLSLTTKKEKEELENISYSEIFNFYSKVVNDFLDMQIPTMSVLSGAMNSMAESASEDEDTPLEEEAK